MGTITKGRFIGSDAAFKSRKSKSLSSSMNLSSKRKDSLEKKAIDDKKKQEQEKTKEISRREKERQSMRKEFKSRVTEASNPDRNTDERRKVVNVGRPDTAKTPMDTRSKLVKQSEIKNKIIENQEKSMTFKNYHNLPDDLVAAVRDVMEKKNPFAKDDDKSPKKDDDSDDADDKKAKSKKDDDSDDDDKKPKSKKKDDDSDDDQDKMVGKDGKKTKVDLNPTIKMANEELKGNQKKLDKNHNGKLDAQDFKMLRKEEVEQVDEKAKWRHGYHATGHPAGYKHKSGAIGPIGGTYTHDTHYDQEFKVPVHKYRDAADPLANRDKTKLAQSGKPLVKKNAERNLKTAIKSAKGTHGPVNKLPEEVSLSDEETARILAKLNEAGDEDDHQDGPEHIVMQLRKAKSLGADNRPITIPPNAGEIRVTGDGTILAGTQVVGQMKIVGFSNDRALKRGPNSLMIANEQPQRAPQAKVVQGVIEESNVVPMFELARMTEVVRNFQQTSNLLEQEHDRQRDAVRRIGKPSNA